MMISTRSWFFHLGILLLGIGLGTWIQGGAPSDVHKHEAEAQLVDAWTCSMHPQIRMPSQSHCPICAMDLIPMARAAAGELTNSRQLRMSPAAQVLADIQTVPVVRRFVPVERRMAGKVTIDETRVRHITAWVSGRIDRLYIDYTGVRVAAGDHMAYLYSPELMTAQEELIQALRARDRMRDRGSETIGYNAWTTVAAARDKLRLLGLKREQIARIEAEREASDQVTIYAPLGGVVIEKYLTQGAYVQTGTPIYTVADLSRLWLELAAYESDLPWVRYGQELEYTTEALPGAVLTGRVSFIDPILDERTRTVRVRVNVVNDDGRLKPGMLVQATVKTQVSGDGRVMDAALAGKWISPMHPEIVRNGPGACDICGMALVRAEDLGYLPIAKSGEAPLVIPVSAPLITGKRAVVYVALGDGLYEGREVSLGAKAGDFYLVRQGLMEGEDVVTNGAFKIDSALQIQAKPSMMNPQAAASAPEYHYYTDHEDRSHRNATGEHVDFQVYSEEWNAAESKIYSDSLEPLFEVYLEIQRALSRDDLHRAYSGAQALAQALSVSNIAIVDDPAHNAWRATVTTMRKQATAIKLAIDIDVARRNFAALSKTLIDVVLDVGPGASDLYLFQCPMAFDYHGAQWLQRSKKTENPYFGNAMYRCGNLFETIGGGE